MIGTEEIMVPLPRVIRLIDSQAQEKFPSLEMNQYYTYSLKGWDLKNTGKEVYLVNELKQWIPADYFRTTHRYSPN